MDGRFQGGFRFGADTGVIFYSGEGRCFLVYKRFYDSTLLSSVYECGLIFSSKPALSANKTQGSSSTCRGCDLIGYLCAKQAESANGKTRVRE
jgi:hypothetical protein